METIVMQNFWGKQGALWSMWKWWMPESFLQINRYFALMSYYNTIGQSNNKESVFWSFHPLANKTPVKNFIALCLFISVKIARQMPVELQRATGTIPTHL